MMEVQQNQTQEQQQKQLTTLSALFLIEYSPVRDIYCAVLNHNRRLLQVFHFAQNQHFTNFEALLIQLNVRDPDTKFTMYLPQVELDMEREKIADKTEGMQVTTFKPTAVREENAEEALAYLLKKQLKHYLTVLKKPRWLQALNELIMKDKLLKDSANKGKFDLEVASLHTYMKLDMPAITSLQIMPKKLKTTRVIQSRQTLFQMLNHCKTVIGTRCLKRWMLQPLQNPEAIKSRLDTVEFLKENPHIRKYLSDTLFRAVPDLDKLYYLLYKVASGKNVNYQLADLVKIYRLTRALEDYSRYLEGVHSTDDACTKNLHKQISDQLRNFDRLQAMIEKMVEFGSRDSECVIKSSCKAELHNIRKQQREVQNRIQDLAREAQEELGLEVKLVESNAEHYLFEAKKTELGPALKRFPDYASRNIRGQKMTFTNRALMNQTSNLKRLAEQYQLKQKDILKEMFGVFAGYYPDLEGLSLYLSELDVLNNFSNIVSQEGDKLVRPNISSEVKMISGRGLTHPCLKECIPNDFQPGNSKTVVITGPNMGGKSTYIRILGICVYLAHIGFYVPARSFECPIIDAIITRVGGSDFISRGISTFMNEMMETSCMLSTATGNSLVLIDELGRGTSTHEGFGIAWAIAEYLQTEIRPFCLFATHFHEMTRMEDQIPGVMNMFAECSLVNGQLKMDYKIVPGKVSKSYGINLAESLGFPTQLIQNAREFAEELEQFQEKITHSQTVDTQKRKDSNSLNYEVKVKVLKFVEANQDKMETEELKRVVLEMLKLNEVEA